jgi:two-component system LytT family response regulator
VTSRSPLQGSKPREGVAIRRTLHLPNRPESISTSPFFDRGKPFLGADDGEKAPTRGAIMRALMVDQEPIAHGALGKLLAAKPLGLVVDVVDNGAEALARVAKRPYDLLLLDVHMPGLWELLDQLKSRGEPKASVVLATAAREQAGFDGHSVRCPSKNRAGARSEMAEHRGQGLCRANATPGEPAQVDRAAMTRAPKIGIKTSGRIVFIDLREVRIVRAEGNYVSLERQAGVDLLREPLSLVAEKLRAYGFIQIHRSVLVNTSLVEEIRVRPCGDYGLRVSGGKEYIVSRTYKKNLKSLAELWIGVSPLLSE